METSYAETAVKCCNVVMVGGIAPVLGLRYFEKPVAGYWFNNISQ